jgi:hypothetical protein
LSLHIFEVCTIKVHRFFGVGCFLGFSPSLCDSNIRIAFRAVLSLTRNFWMNPSRPFSSRVFCMITRRSIFALVDIVLLFELWIFIPRIMFHGPAVPPCFTGEGSQFLGLPYLGKPRRLVLRVVDFNPSKCSLAGNTILPFKSWLLIP